MWAVFPRLRVIKSLSQSRAPDKELIPATCTVAKKATVPFGVISLPAEDGRCCSKFGLTKMSSDEATGRFSLKNEAEIGRLSREGRSREHP